MALSIAGGDEQDQAAIQLILNHVEFNMDSEEVFSAPRFSTSHFINSFGQNYTNLGSLAVPNTLSKEIQDDLKTRGHNITYNRQVGYVTLIGIDYNTKKAIGMGPASHKQNRR